MPVLSTPLEFLNMNIILIWFISTANFLIGVGVGLYVKGERFETLKKVRPFRRKSKAGVVKKLTQQEINRIGTEAEAGEKAFGKLIKEKILRR